MNRNTVLKFFIVPLEGKIFLNKFVHCFPLQCRWSQSDKHGFSHASVLKCSTAKVYFIGGTIQGKNARTKPIVRSPVTIGRNNFPPIRAEGGADFTLFIPAFKGTIRKF
jgi:hypothetical protein